MQQQNSKRLDASTKVRQNNLKSRQDFKQTSLFFKNNGPKSKV